MDAVPEKRRKINNIHTTPTCSMTEDTNEDQLLKQGAEAKLYISQFYGKPAIIKERFQKMYRHPDLDKNLTTERLKAEARAIVKCRMAGIHTPALYNVDLPMRRITMEHVIDSVTVKDYMTDLLAMTNASSTADKFLQLGNLIGTTLGKMHAHNIVHGDLTTSNILLRKHQNGCQEPVIILIDFGLSHLDGSIEDKGVDLYVLERAVLSTHPNTETFLNNVYNYYQKEYKKGAPQVMKKLDEVRLRGRKRKMVG